jgi:hypothetical protein
MISPPRRLAAPLLLACFLGWAVPACDGGSAATANDGGGAGNGGVGSASGLAPAKLVRELTDAELRTLCDWTAAKAGGYGHVTSCDGGITFRAKCSTSALLGPECAPLLTCA